MRVALVQIVSTPDPQRNLDLVCDGIRAAEGARLVVFPEATMCCFGVPLGPVAEPLDGPWATRVRHIADSVGTTVVAGMFTPAPDGRVYNTLLVTGGGVEASYNKLHLFDAFNFRESDTVAPGDEVVTVDLDGLTLGLATCYDLRFPALFQALGDKGAQLVAAPASWGNGPGKLEQFQLMVRARAADSTAFVLGCDQGDPETIGQPRRNSPTGTGGSTVAGPLGDVRGELGPAPGVLIADIDVADVAQTRAVLPVLANRRRF